jgi:hypothetical protein
MSFIDFINQIETGNYVDARATFEQLLDSALEEELETTLRAVSLSMFGEGVDLQELNKTTLRSYINKVETSMRGTTPNKTPAKKLWKRTKGVEKAGKKLQELNKKTLASYAKKAIDSKSDADWYAGRSAAKNPEDDDKKSVFMSGERAGSGRMVSTNDALKTSEKRSKGLKRAIDKMSEN